MNANSSSKMFCFLITILLCFISSVISQPYFVSYACFAAGNYAENSAYQTSLKDLFSTINTNSKIDYGFYNFSSGGAHAIALCRGDVTVAECRRCVNESTIKLPQVCPRQKQAVGWYDNCTLRYSNSSDIFGPTRSPFPFTVWRRSQNVTNTTPLFDPSLVEFLRSTASLGDSRRKFASGESVSLANLGRIYGLVQCTPDLNRTGCTRCIDEAVNQIRNCCGNPQSLIGARFLGTSCNARFEMYKFFGSTTVPPPSTATFPPPRPPPPAAETMVQTNTTNSSGSKGKNTSRKIIIFISAVSIVAAVVLIIFICIYLRSRKPRKNIATMAQVITMESLQYSFSTIKFATNNFSDANKLGQGGFGAVYKGTLWDGQEIAVKRLAIGSGQGEREFKTEIVLVAKLQHRNLVRLLGFCLEGEERLLIYEFLPNSSLDQFLFDKVKRYQLDWETRYKIIGGIVKGLLYLHEDSRLRIIHRDLKVSNILLDAEMNPKIADFGLAKLFAINQTQGDTSRIVGTYGYMAPEYAMRGHFSVKSDVYSFGVLVLEIISGQKNTCFRNVQQQPEDLISYAWESWKYETISNLVDPTLTSGSNSEIMRCIHIGLLSVQENVSDRPTMTAIASMLNNYSITLPVPSQPSFVPKIAETDLSGLSVNDMSITDLYSR